MTSYAVLSCDLDTVDRHLQGYGFEGLLLDPECDRVDARLARHPGMRVPVEQKFAVLRDVPQTIMRERRVVTHRQALAEGLAGEEIR